MVSVRSGEPGLQHEECNMNSIARRMFELVEPIGAIPYSADEIGRSVDRQIAP